MLKMYQPEHDRMPSIEELEAVAGDATTRPPDPPEGIPQQWVPSWIRWPLRVLILPFVWLDLASQKVAKMLIKTPYKQEGSCLRRGNCCHYILLAEPKGFLGRLFFFWYTQINGFFLRNPQPIKHEGHRVVVMGCRYLMKNGSCKHHRLRPTLCRQWPLIEYFGYPRILKGCGYKAVPRSTPTKKTTS